MLDPILTPLLMGAAFSLAKDLGGEVVKYAAEGVLDEVRGHAVNEAYKSVKGALRSRKGGLPANHDVVRAVRKAQLRGLAELLDVFERQVKRGNQPTSIAYARQARQWVESRLDDVKKLTPGGVEEAAVAAIETTLAASPSDLQRSAQRDAELATWEELALAVPNPPDRLYDLFRDGQIDRLTWFECFGQFLREELKEDERFQKILTNSQIADLSSKIDRFSGPAARQLSEIHAVVVSERTTTFAAQPPDAPSDSGMRDVETVRRLCVTPVGATRPRPVNLLMALGVSRLAAVAVTLDVEAAALALNLRAGEASIGGLPDAPYKTRTWGVGPPETWSGGGARGAVWQIVEEVSADTVWRALATMFGKPDPGCGNVLVLALPAEALACARALFETIVRAKADTRGLEDIPVYFWRAGAPDAGPEDALLNRIRGCVETGQCGDRSTDVQAVVRMRLHAAPTLASDWESADRELIRLHELSVLSSSEADRPTSLDEMRAVDLIYKVERNQSLLSSVAFMPVSDTVIATLAEGPLLARAVAGLLTPQQLSAPSPSYSRRLVQGYRPAQVAVPEIMV